MRNKSWLHICCFCTCKAVAKVSEKPYIQMLFIWFCVQHGQPCIATAGVLKSFISPSIFSHLFFVRLRWGEGSSRHIRLLPELSQAPSASSGRQRVSCGTEPWWSSRKDAPALHKTTVSDLLNVCLLLLVRPNWLKKLFTDFITFTVKLVIKGQVREREADLTFDSSLLVWWEE